VFQKSIFSSIVLAASLAAAPAHAVIVSDIVMLVDESGSMGDVQTNLRNNIGTFASILASGGVDARFALVGYGNSSVAPRLLTNFTDATGFATSAAGLQTTGGTEPGYSATAFALNALDGQSSTLAYRSNALKNIVIFTDEPSNGDSSYRVNGITVTLNIVDQLLTDNNALFNAVLRIQNTITSYGPLATGHGGHVYDLNGLNTTNQSVVQQFVADFSASKLKEIQDFCTLNPNDPACLIGDVPEPGTLLLIGVGALGARYARRRRA
jgi:hypothetical protein